MKHTQEPWEHDGKYIYAKDVPILRIHPNGLTEEDARGCIELATRAPELLKALETIANRLTKGSRHNASDKAMQLIAAVAEDAIRKAKGEL